MLSWAEAAGPHAGAGQVRIAVRAASVNPIDWKLVSGAMCGGRPLAGTGDLGYDAAGVVDEVGPEVGDTTHQHRARPAGGRRLRPSRTRSRPPPLLPGADDPSDAEALCEIFGPVIRATAEHAASHPESELRDIAAFLAAHRQTLERHLEANNRTPSEREAVVAPR